MNSNDYYGHYKAFVKALSEYPDLTLQQYCKEHDVIWRRLYDWMHRNKISLKRLYANYRHESVPMEIKHERIPQFCELLPSQSSNGKADQCKGNVMVGMSRIVLPSGVVMELKDCPVSALSVLLSQCIGKEVSNVRP